MEETTTEIKKRGPKKKEDTGVITMTGNVEKFGKELKTITEAVDTNLIGRKVSTVRLHQATNINTSVKSGVGTKDADITVVPGGVLLIFKTTTGKKVERFISNNNIYEFDLA